MGWLTLGYIEDGEETAAEPTGEFELIDTAVLGADALWDASTADMLRVATLCVSSPSDVT